ncbi:hypothetical protein [Diaphorobacter aerolatus]|uniref:hypothetical protein n=1 Tax=Diaphorobacter aerolatus TaxID=1288495 RepID=UPI001D005F5B|nr:hypothetical protein [Diaphorobacter aerolatus]
MALIASLVQHFIPRIFDTPVRYRQINSIENEALIHPTHVGLPDRFRLAMLDAGSLCFVVRYWFFSYKFHPLFSCKVQMSSLRRLAVLR